MDDRRKISQTKAENCGRHGSAKKLALGANIKQTGLEGKCHSKSAEDQRCRFFKGTAHSSDIAKRALQQGRIGPQWIGAMGCQNNGAN